MYYTRPIRKTSIVYILYALTIKCLKMGGIAPPIIKKRGEKHDYIRRCKSMEHKIQ